jgi:sacsin
MKPYGQQEPLTRRIHSILRDYPAGTQIMKELLQNADDARYVLHASSSGSILLVTGGLCRASDVTFMLDLRVGTDPRLSPRMANPSLFCYNNKPFAEKDFVSLQNLGQSCKRQDTSSTGRFGIGFNRYTELLSILLLLLLLVEPEYCVCNRRDALCARVLFFGIERAVSTT